MRKPMNVVMTVVMSMLFFMVGSSWAHSPIFTCFSNGDGSIICEGAFSDGSSAAGAAVEVRDAQGRLLSKHRLDVSGTIELTKPAGDGFVIIFDGGPRHQVKIKSSEIPD